MNCPFHNLIYQSSAKSYRDLPLRLFEFGTVYRYEKSGVVHGITRARGFTQDDAHIYCTKEQMAGELDSLLTFVLNLLRDYGLEDFYLELSTRNPEKSVGSDADGRLQHMRCAKLQKNKILSWFLIRVELLFMAPKSQYRPKMRSVEPGRCLRFK